MKDYYRTLGVLDDAEDIIIRAAYKALAQRYHPDKWKGDPQEANKRMSDINEAYDVLSDSTKRKKYDEEYFRNRARDESTEEDESDANFISEEDEAWQIACEFFPKIKEEYLHLSKISKILANTFKATVINNQDFNSSTTVKNKLESDYLKRYYGEDLQIQNLVKELLISGYQKAAVRINKVVRALGKSASYEKIENKILEEFPETKRCINLFYKSKYSDQLKKNTISPRDIVRLFKYIKPNVEITARQLFWGDLVFDFEVNEKNQSMKYYEIVNFLWKEMQTLE